MIVARASVAAGFGLASKIAIAATISFFPIVVKFVGSRRGSGNFIMQDNFNLKTAGIFTLPVVLSMIGVGLHFAVLVVQHTIIFWQGS